MDTYEVERNALIPVAEEYADSVAMGHKDGKPYRVEGWVRVYIREMDRLATERGLQRVRFHK